MSQIKLLRPLTNLLRLAVRHFCCVRITVRKFQSLQFSLMVHMILLVYMC